MLQTEHQHMRYTLPRFAVERSSTRPRGYSEIFARSCRVIEISIQNEPIRIDDSGELPVEELMALYEPIRHDLALRRLKGEPLSQREQLVLEIFNKLLDIFLERPKKEPPEVTQAVEEAKLLLYELENG